MFDQIKNINFDIFVFIPIVPQGSGKTFFYENVLQPFFKSQPYLNLKLISSEKVHSKLIQKYQKINPFSSLTEAFQKTKKQYKKEYEQKIKSVFKEIYFTILRNSLDTREKQFFFIYIDKHFPFNDSSQINAQNKLRTLSGYNNLKFISLTLKKQRVNDWKKQNEEVPKHERYRFLFK
jgi:hypothetical protein